MDWITGKLTTAGGAFGGFAAYLLNIDLIHITEVALYALVGAAIGEGVKESVLFVKKKFGK
jgi:hypothetical protein